MGRDLKYTFPNSVFFFPCLTNSNINRNPINRVLWAQSTRKGPLPLVVMKQMCELCQICIEKSVKLDQNMLTFLVGKLVFCFSNVVEISPFLYQKQITLSCLKMQWNILCVLRVHGHFWDTNYK